MAPVVLLSDGTEHKLPAAASVAEATAAVAVLPPSAYRDALLYFAAYSIERDR